MIGAGAFTKVDYIVDDPGIKTFTLTENFDLEIKEDAYLNYAKLSYQIGNSYKSPSIILNEFLKKYPKDSIQQTKVFHSIEEVCADKLVDAVYIASPNHLHAPQPA